MLTKSYTGRICATLRNNWTTQWENKSEGVAGFPMQYAVAGARVETGYQDGEISEGMMPVGQGVGMVNEIVRGRRDWPRDGTGRVEDPGTTWFRRVEAPRRHCTSRTSGRGRFSKPA